MEGTEQYFVSRLKSGYMRWCTIDCNLVTTKRVILMLYKYKKSRQISIVLINVYIRGK